VLHWAIVFFVIAILAALFGYGGLAPGSAGLAKVVFFAFLLLTAISLMATFGRGRRA
jgi:uncharacterized membrane protein YtjA (UPF0391 family)